MEGEQIFLSALVSRTSHLYCYYVGSDGGVMRLLPNALQPNSLVTANQAVRIPDWMAPNPGFILDAGKPGVESVVCVATESDAMPKLSAELQKPALTIMPGVRGAEDLQQRFAAAMGAQGQVSQVVQWSVVPRPVPPVAQQLPAPAARRK